MSTTNGKNGTPSAKGRNGNGTFVKGHNGGPGNPQIKALSAFRMAWSKASKAKHVTEAYEWLYKAWSGEDFPPAVRMKAFELFMDRTVGKVKETVEIEGGIDADEVRAGVLAFLHRENRN